MQDWKPPSFKRGPFFNIQLSCQLVWELGLGIRGISFEEEANCPHVPVGTTLCGEKSICLACKYARLQAAIIFKRGPFNIQLSASQFGSSVWELGISFEEEANCPHVPVGTTWRGWYILFSDSFASHFSSYGNGAGLEKLGISFEEEANRLHVPVGRTLCGGTFRFR
ncbi:hypothetical protein CEXT_734871 [Caerostris extrusa]|uniref:Uncharacterized protein n=1 Tax=Caerostris extrusa TaxID=172846 RepID=A0AAV4MNC4_CAEEX|nr:hypothetical protein CEXT_734871 [Caerostris extrusa]